MSAEKYLVSTKFQGRTLNQTWDPREPMKLGVTDRGALWVLEKSKSGAVRIRSLSLIEGEVANAHTQVLAPEEAIKGIQIKFNRRGYGDIALKIKSIYRPNLSDTTQEAEVTRAKKTEFTVYRSENGWSIQETIVSWPYVAVSRGQECFVCEQRDGFVRVTARKDGLALRDHKGEVTKLSKDKEKVLKEVDFYKIVIRDGAVTWSFGGVYDFAGYPTFISTGLDPETKRVVRNGAVIALLILLLMLWEKFSPKPVVEEVISPQMVKILTKKERRVRKLESPVKQQEEKKETPIAKSQEVSPAKPKELIIPKGIAVPKASKAQQARIQQVKNLYAGLMKGGLSKILDNKQLVNNAQPKNAASKLSGDLKNFASSMGGLNINISNLKQTDSKIAGFGGDRNAAVKGAPSVGYSDGVKGQLSGVGGGVALGSALAELDDDGGLTKEQVGRVIHAHQDKVRLCYDSAMRRSSKVEGKVYLAFTINKNGQVTSASVDRARTDVSDSDLGECLRSYLVRWAFPKPHKGIDVKVTYPFLFRTLGGR